MSPKWKKRSYIIFGLLAIVYSGVGILLDRHASTEQGRLQAEVAQQTALTGHLSSQVDTLVDIQSRIAAAKPPPKPPPIAVDLNALKQELKDERERTQIALDSIERRLSQIKEVHKDDLRTRALQTSRDLLALLYQHRCDVDTEMARTNPEFFGQIYGECIKRMRDEYLKTYQQPTLQIINELEKRGLDVRHVRGLAEIGWNHTVVERVAIELSQLAERLPKES